MCAVLELAFKLMAGQAWLLDARLRSLELKAKFTSD